MFVVFAIVMLSMKAFSLGPFKYSGKTDNAVVVIGKFRSFKGCNLTKLWYDEEKSNLSIEGYLQNGKGSMNGAKAENVIVLLSNYDVDSSGGDGSLNPNSTYSYWSWTLIRNSKTSDWKVDDWGY
jgi:hypothetical protein